jgi:mRNA interferase RelE/StbE
MTYSLFILRRAQKELADLPPEEYEKIKLAVLNLSKKPRPAGCRKLSGREGWRIRVGNFRVIYEIDEEKKAVTILHAGHRRDVYR